MNLNEKTMQKASVVVCLAASANLLWGSAPAFIKTGYAMFHVAANDIASQILFAGCRFFLAGILAVLLGSLLNGGWLLPRKSALPKIAVLALFQTIIQYIFFYIGCANAAGYKVSIATSTGSFISILISALIFRQEKLTGRKILGCVLGFAGVVLVNLGSAGSLSLDMSFSGEGCIMLSTVSFALSTVLSKSYSKTENPVMLCGWQFILGGAVMIGVSLLLGGRLAPAGFKGSALLLYLAMVSALAFSFNSILVKYNPVSRISVFNFLNPIFGVLLSVFMLNEGSQVFGLKGITALMLVCLGVFTVNYNSSKASKR